MFMFVAILAIGVCTSTFSQTTLVAHSPKVVELDTRQGFLVQPQALEFQ